MRQHYWFITLLLLLAACRPATDGGTPFAPDDDGVAPQPTTAGDRETEMNLTTPDPTSLPEGYPPTDPTLPEGYPDPPPPLPTIDPYPGGLIWIIRPFNEQCAAAEQAPYADLRQAVQSLISAGIPVNASETTNLMVCQACDCPTSEHFRAQIGADYLDLAESLDWNRE